MSFLAKLFSGDLRNPARKSVSARAVLVPTQRPVAHWNDAVSDEDDDDEDDEDGGMVSPSKARPAPRRGSTLDQCAFFSRTSLSPVAVRRRSIGEGGAQGSLTTLLEGRISGVSIEKKAAGRKGSSQFADLRSMTAVMKGRNCTIMAGYRRGVSLCMRPAVAKVFTKVGMSVTARLRIQREVDVLKAASAVPNVMRYLSTHDDENSLMTVVEQAPGLNLIELMASRGGRLPADQCASEVALPLLRAIAGLHAAGIVHRHLKPEHVMCHSGGATLIDFTDAAFLEQRCLNSCVGEMPYIAPEVLTKPRAEDVFHEVLLKGMAEEELPQYNEKADVWSFGVILFEALTGQQPFLAESMDEMISMQHTALSKRTGSYPTFIARRDIDECAKDLIACTLTLDPEARPSAAALIKHGFFKGAVMLPRVRTGPRSLVQLVQQSCPQVPRSPEKVDEVDEEVRAS